MIFNLTKKKLIASNPVFFRSRAVGLAKVFGNDFCKNDAIVLQNRKTIFTYFLSLHIDMIFTDFENKACNIFKGGIDRKLYYSCNKAHHIICLPRGQVDHLDIEKGDRFNLNIELTKEFKKKLEKSISRGVVSSPTVMSEK